jgi:hypothetical protein
VDQRYFTNPLFRSRLTRFSLVPKHPCPARRLPFVSRWWHFALVAFAVGNRPVLGSLPGPIGDFCSAGRTQSCASETNLHARVPLVFRPLSVVRGSRPSGSFRAVTLPPFEGWTQGGAPCATGFTSARGVPFVSRRCIHTTGNGQRTTDQSASYQRTAAAQRPRPLASPTRRAIISVGIWFFSACRWCGLPEAVFNRLSPAY